MNLWGLWVQGWEVGLSRGGIRLRVAFALSENSGGFVKIRVQDDGPAVASSLCS